MYLWVYVYWENNGGENIGCENFGGDCGWVGCFIYEEDWCDG